jgi:MFS transporter, AAHS family, 4-hydroxybenzoate transporter
MDSRVHSFRNALDARPVSPFQIRLLLMAIGLMIMDGYDVQVIGYVAPVLVKLWQIDRSAFGPIFSAGLVGLTIGSLLVSPISDKVGCRPVLIGCTAIYGVLTLVTAFANSWTMLLVLRFLTGLALAGALPSTIALVSDYAPTRHRNLMVAMVACGFALGGALGGFVAAATISKFGWEAVFIIGGVVPLITIPLFWRWLPEALPRLLDEPAPRARLATVVAEIVPGWKVPEHAASTKGQRSPVAALFNPGYVIPTLLIWTMCFCSLMVLFFFINWIPTVMSGSGHSLKDANMAAGVFQLASICGALILSHVSDRTGRTQMVMGCAYICAAVGCYLFGSAASSSFSVLMACAAFAGFTISAQGVANAFVGNYYPAAIRATGVGWAGGIGRFGAILGPLFAALLLSHQVTTQTLFTVFAILPLIAGICAFLVKRSPDLSTSAAGHAVAGPKSTREVSS